jgi:hypothetical protein
MELKVDVVKVRKSLEQGLATTGEQLVTASEVTLGSPTRLNKRKVTKARARYNSYVEALEMSDEELKQEFLAGTLFK